MHTFPIVAAPVSLFTIDLCILAFTSHLPSVKNSCHHRLSFKIGQTSFQSNFHICDTKIFKWVEGPTKVNDTSWWMTWSFTPPTRVQANGDGRPGSDQPLKHSVRPRKGQPAVPLSRQVRILPRMTSSPSKTIAQCPKEVYGSGGVLFPMVLFLIPSKKEWSL